MASNENGLSSRCISLLEEVKGLLEDSNRQNNGQIDAVNVGASTSRQGSTASRENQGEDIPTTSTTTSTSSHSTSDQQRSSRALQNFRSLFAPYAASSRNNWLRPPLAKKPKKGPFQVKETWTHEFFCLAKKCAIRVPSRLEKVNLQNSGLGRKKIVFKCNASSFDVQKVLQDVYPKLSEAGGFELLRSGHPCTSLVLITPPVTGYSVPFLRDSAGLGQALAYIRPLQKDIDLSTLVVEETEQVEDDNVPCVKCIECNENVAMTRFRSHQCNVTCIESDSKDPKADDGTSVSKLREIFTSTSPQEIERAMKMSDGNISLAAHQILTDSEGTCSTVQFEDTDTGSDSELLKNPFDADDCKPVATPCSTLKELMFCHKRSLNLQEENFKRISIDREELWHESIAIFKNPSCDVMAVPLVKFRGEVGIDAGGVRREYGSLLVKEIFSATANLFEGRDDRKLPIYSSDNMCSRMFEIAGKIISYLIIHLNIGIPCLSPAAYHYISTSTIVPDCCSIEDVVDLELKELILKVDNASSEADINTLMENEFFTNALITAGWLQSLTLANRHRAMQTIIVYDVLTKRKAPLDQFIKGLATLGVHQLIKSSPELMKRHFVNTTGPLTSDDVIESLKFPEEDENHLAKEFLIQSIRELENEHGSSGLERFLHYMTSLDKIPPLGLDKKIEVDFRQDDNPDIFADTCSFFLRIPTVHKTFVEFKQKVLVACDNFLGHGVL